MIKKKRNFRRRRCTCCLEYRRNCKNRQFMAPSAATIVPKIQTLPMVQLRLSSDEAATVTAAATAAKNYRRGSLAATLHANLINLGHPDALDVARRRLSNVSDVVSRKLSSWRTVSISVELTVLQV